MGLLRRELVTLYFVWKVFLATGRLSKVRDGS